MKPEQLHTILLESRHITAIAEDTDELCECECRLWDNDNVTLLLEFAENGNADYHRSCLVAIDEKLAWIERERAHICAQAQVAPNAMIGYISLYIENPTTIFADFTLCPNSEHCDTILAEVGLEEDNTLSINEN